MLGVGGERTQLLVAVYVEVFVKECGEKSHDPLWELSYEKQ